MSKKPRFTLLMLFAAGAMLSAPGLSQGQSLGISRADCRKLIYHQPSADVAYEPGKDAYGREVVSADLNADQQLRIPETIWIPVEVDLFDRYNIPANEDNFAADAQIGVVVVRNGRSYFNGQPLQDEEQAVLAEKCQQLLNNSLN